MKKRVLIVATVQSHIGQFHKPLMKMLKERGWEVHIAARNNLAEKNGLQLEYPDRVIDVPFQRSPFDLRNFIAYIKLRRVLSENRYDVVHCNTPVGGVLGRIVAKKYRRRGTKVYYTAHGFHFYKGAPIKNWVMYYPVEKFLSRWTDKLITITKEDYELAKHKLHCEIVRIHGVGANSHKFHPVSEIEKQRLRSELGIDGTVILNVGELLPNKNQKTAIAVVAKLCERIPDIHLLIAGEGPERERLEEQISKIGLKGRVTLLGYTTQVQKYMQACDVLLACSYREGLPLNVMEAMLCGKPVVASNNRGHRELVQQGVTGLIIEADDVASYAKAIVEALGQGWRMGAAARKRADNYTDVSVSRELESIYFDSDMAL